MNRVLGATIVGLVLMAGIAQARNIDLVTLPPRDTVQLTIYNSEDLTLCSAPVQRATWWKA